MGAGQRGPGQSAAIDRIVASGRGRVPTESEKAFYRDLIEGLAARRRALGISQARLDAMLGVSDHQVAHWESYRRLPGAFMMMCWASSLGVKLVAKREE